MHELWVKNQDKREHQAATFLDLSAAFDTLSKDIFCKKMKIYGFDKKSVNWFDSYLTDRAQSVMVGSEMPARPGQAGAAEAVLCFAAEKLGLAPVNWGSGNKFVQQQQASVTTTVKQ